MSHQTNDTVSIYRRTRDWKGKISDSLLGSYDVWNEERKTVKVDDIGVGTGNVVEGEKGIFILFSNIDLTDCYVVSRGGTFEAVDYDYFYDRLGDFHHIECKYK